MHLSLYIPQLLDRAPSATPQAAPALARLLAAAGSIDTEPDGAIAALAPRYGIARQHDWPLAALRVASLGLDPGRRYWLRATPVLLEAGRDDVRVGGAVRDLDEGEAGALLDTLSRHFAGDGLTFTAGAPHDWFVATDQAPALHTHPLVTAVGQRVRPRLAEGDDAPQWRRWGQEIEMLLHDHPVNVAREREGRTIVNSVWWQHGGVLPGRTTAKVQTWSDDDDLGALAVHVGTPAASVPSDISHTWNNARGSDVVISVPVEATLDQIDARFAAPLSRALEARNVQTVDVILDGSGKPALRWRLARQGWMRRLLQRSPAPLGQIVDLALRATP